MPPTASRRYVALWGLPLLAAVFLAASCGGGVGTGGASSSRLGEEMYTEQMYATTTPSASQVEAARDAMRESNATPESTVLTTPSGEEVLFALHNSPVPGVGYTGRLIEEAGCIRLVISGSAGNPRKSGTSPTVLWPGFGFSVRFGEDGEIVIIDEGYEGRRV